MHLNSSKTAAKIKIMNLYNFVKKYNISKTLFVVYFTFFTLIIYFISCIIFGQKGLITYFALREEINNRDIIKQELINEVNAKKNKVDGMNVESLDLDLLDEEARKNLGHSNKNEVVIYKNEEEQK